MGHRDCSGRIGYRISGPLYLQPHWHQGSRRFSHTTENAEDTSPDGSDLIQLMAN
jgi:hypothetical protein